MKELINVISNNVILEGLLIACCLLPMMFLVSQFWAGPGDEEEMQNTIWFMRFFKK